tara:strand:- start:14685 stop:15542 length:858 start_codon:yes stop_codon:yes gene_type:complete
MRIQHYFQPSTSTLTYLVYDEKTKDAVLIDSTLDYDEKSSSLSHASAEIMLTDIKNLGLHVHYLLETHAHADHLTGIEYMKEHLPNAKTAIHEDIRAVQNVFRDLFQLEKNDDGSDFDVLLKDGQELEVGPLKIKVLHTPGHTPACVSYLINEEAVFTGDLIFAPDYGTGRCDFPKGSAKKMYDSITQKIYTLGDDVKVYPGHDYSPNNRVLWVQSTVGQQKRLNPWLNAETSEADFVKKREARDSGLPAPKLLLQSVQFNAWAGKMPENGKDGASFLKLPLRKK